MSTEKEKVLSMLEQGTINAEEASKLLSALEEKEGGQSSLKARESAHLKGKKLRVEVKGDTEKDKKINVNVSVPLVLARHVENIIANIVPDSATDELKKTGIDLKSLNIGQIIDTVEGIDEDIVNADIDQDDVNLKVRVYVE